MDETFDTPIPELPDTPETNPVVLDPASILGDPLCQMLGKLEASIELPVLGLSPDPSCDIPDELESYVERQRPVIDCSPDPMNEILSQLEKRIESRYSAAPTPQETLPMQAGLPQANGQSHPLFAQPQKPQAFKGESLLHRYPQPTHRIGGQNTGIRNSGNGFDWYCYVRGEWVSKEECGDCPDFEEADYGSDNEDRRCKHSFGSSEDRDEKEDGQMETEYTE